MNGRKWFYVLSGLCAVCFLSFFTNKMEYPAKVFGILTLVSFLLGFALKRKPNKEKKPKKKKEPKKVQQNPTGRLYVDWSAYEEAQKPRPADEQSRPAVPQISCPRCGCTQIYAAKKGFSAGKAIAGGLIAGPVGLVGGAIGRNNVVVTCLGCGHKWKV